MERRASSTSTRYSKLAWLFRLMGALLRLVLFLALLVGWAGVFSTGSMMFVYGALRATILYLLLWGFTYVCSRHFRQGLHEVRPAHILFAGLPPFIAAVSLLLGFAYFSGQQQGTYIGILVGTAILLGLAFYIGESLDKRNPDITLLDGCVDGCFELFISSLHI